MKTHTNRRDFLTALGLGAAALTLPRLAGSAAAGSPAANAAGAAGSQRPPNIVYFIIDELAPGDLSCTGNKYINTPNVDRLAAEGTRFTQALAGGPVCAPTRSTLMTGQHTGHTTVRANGGGLPLRADDVTIAEVLERAGYATGGFGKWGLGDRGSTGVPERHGFDVFFGYYHQVHAQCYYPTYLIRNGEKAALEGNTGDMRKGKQYSQYLIFNEAVKFIRENKDRPFFCYCPFTPPHGVCAIPEDDPAWLEYKDKPWKTAKGADFTDAKTYAAMVGMIDRQVGQIMALLKDMGLDENTIVFLSGDNGGNRYCGDFFQSNAPFRGKKGDLYEGGLRVPMIVRWPGKIKAGAVSDFLWYFPDVFPTLAELAHAEAPKDLDGISIVPALLGEAVAGRRQETHEFLYWEYGAWTAVRMGNWKAVKPAARKRAAKKTAKGAARGPANSEPKSSGELAAWELYDLSTDIGEQRNVAAQHPDIAAKMAAFAQQSHTEDHVGTWIDKSRAFKGQKESAATP